MHKLLSFRLFFVGLAGSLLLLGSTLAFEKETLVEVAPPKENVNSPVSLVKNEDGGYRLTANSVSVSELTRQIAEKTGISIITDDALARQIVSVDETHADLEALIKSISDSNAIVFERHGEDIRLVSAFVSSQQDAPLITEEEELALLEAEGEGEKLVRGYKLTNLSPQTDVSKLNQSRMLAMRNALIHTTRARHGVGIDVPAALAARPDTRWHIVQFEGKIGEEHHRALEQAGFKTGHYVPVNALSVQAEAARLDDLRAIPGVYHVEPYHPYLKVSEDILGYLSGEAPAEIADKVSDGRFTLLTHHHELDLSEIEGLLDIETESLLDGRKMIRVSASPAALVQIAQSDAVQWLEVTPVFKSLNDLGNQRMRANALKRRLPNLTGTGVVVAVTDSGIDTKHSDFALDPAFPTDLGLNTRILAYEHRPSITSDGFIGDTDGHGTHVAGSVLGSGYLSPTVINSPGSTRNASDGYDRYQFGGIAPGAKAVIIEDFNSFLPGEQVAIAWSNQARIANNSWGASIYLYSADSAAWDVLVRDALPSEVGNQEFTAFFAAGNDGGGNFDGTGGQAGTIGTPGNAKNVITIGAVEQPRLANNLPNSIARSDSDWQVADFSSRGPVDVEDDPFELDDVRTKPDLVAPGVFVLSTQSRETNPDVLTDPFGVSWDYSAENVDSGTNYAFFSGTSMASPLAAGVGSLFMEYFKNTFGVNPSPALVKAALVGGARNVNTLVYTHPQDPAIITRTVDQGWGMIDAARSVFGPSIHSTDQIVLVDQEAAISTGEFFSRQITVNPGEGGLKAVLAWTDAPGNPAVERKLVNNLDLLVLAPGGGGYVGNRFDINGIHSERFSIASPAEGDLYNNVEVVLIPDAAPGTYTIRAYGTDIPQGPQDFAMFIMKGVGQERRFAGNRPSIAFNEESRPHVAFSGADAAGNAQVFVKQWRGELGDLSNFGDWLRLDDNWFGLSGSAGNVGISASLAPSLNPAIAVTGNRVYVAWEQHNQDGTNIFVRYYNGTNWTALGSSSSGKGISSNTTYAASRPVIELNNSGQPVVAWRQASLINQKIHVARWNGSAWVGYGTSLTSGVGDSNQAINPTLTINSSGNPVVAWEEQTTQRIHVWQWNGSSWVSLGQRGSAPYAGNPHLDASPSGDIFLTWMQIFSSAPAYQVLAERRTAGSWVSMAGSGSNPGVSAITNSNGQVFAPNIAYSPLPSPRVFVSWLTLEDSNTTVNVKRHILGSANWTGISGSEKYPGVSVAPGANTNVVLATSHLGVPVVSFNNDGAAGIEEVVSYGLVADIVAPSFAGLLAATGGTNQDVRLTWEAANDNLTIATNMRYQIYMSTNKYFCFDVAFCDPVDVYSNLIATVTNLTSFTVTNLAPYETRCFAVRAVDSSGNVEQNTRILYAGPELSGMPCLERDSDGDSLPDWWEYTWFGSLTGADPSSNYMANCAGGLTASNAFVYSTDPFLCDADGDGITDADEVAAGTSPSLADTDNDGLDDADEKTLGSDPLSALSNPLNDMVDGDLIRLGHANPTSVIFTFTVITNMNVEVANLSASGWTKSMPNQAYPLNYWHVSAAKPVDGLAGVNRANDPSPTRSLRMAIDNTAAKTNKTATYNANGNRWVAGLDSPLMDATALDNLFVSFKEYYELEANKDFVEVHARSAVQTNWVVVSAPKTGFSRDWEINTVDLSRFAGEAGVQVRLLFLANDVNNDHAGWYVDDVSVYSGLTIDGWVRDIDGCPVQGANIHAIGIGIVTNTVNGHKMVEPGKIFASAKSGIDGAYMLGGLPAGKFIIKVEHPLYRAEFWDGELFAPTYGFGNLLNPGVPSITNVVNGIVDLTGGGPAPAVHFELEPGSQKALAGISAASTMPVAVNYLQQASIWNGSTSSPASVTWNAMSSLSTSFNNTTWYKPAGAPNYFGSLVPGEHVFGLSNRWSIAPAALNVRDGEFSRAGLVTNAGNGFIYVASLDGISWPVWINGVNSGRMSPALIKVQAGRHLVQLMNAQRLTRAQAVDVPVGGRMNVTFMEEQLGSPNASLVLRTFGPDGSEITGADIFVNGALLTTNMAPGLDRSVTPLTLPVLAGPYAISFRKEGYKLSPAREYGALAGEVTYVYGALSEDDRDYDDVGDATEMDAFDSIYAWSGLDDPDADGLTNRQEFDFTANYGISLDPLDPDTDGDGMLDGDEVGYDGNLNVGEHVLYAYTTLATNAVEDSNNLRLRFNGRYLDGVWNFGSSESIRVSVNGDVVEVAYSNVFFTAPPAPSRACAEAVLTNIPATIVAKAISQGEPVNTRLFADTDPSALDTDGDAMWDGFEFSFQFMINAFGDMIRILDPIGQGAASDDPDADELNNYLEFLGPDGLANTETPSDWSDPRTGDTDSDGMPDGWEYFYGYDPNNERDAFEDPDLDRLVNVLEYEHGSNPTLFDTDGDNLSDGDEVLFYGTDPVNPDTDFDGLFDGQEIELATNPLNPDTDGDGMPDGFEVLDALGQLRHPDARLNPLDASDAQLDADGDGLSNLQEYLIRDGLYGNPPSGYVWDYSADPFNPDSDGDGMPDGWEAYYGLHPADPVIDTIGDTLERYPELGTSGDLDGDGLWNLREYRYRFHVDSQAPQNEVLGYSTDPLNPDTDGDGLWDGEEDRIFGTDAIRQDSDRDGLFDGAGLPPRWGEVETTFRQSEFATLNCGGCTWNEAVNLAKVRHPVFTEITGQLAVISTLDESLAVQAALTGAETEIALGGIISDAGEITWWTGENNLYAPSFDVDAGEPVAAPGYLGLKAGGLAIGRTEADLFDHIMIEWENAPQITNHYDMAMNDLWQLIWPDGDSLPHWEQVNVDPASPVPPSRWGHASSYVPVYETKLPRDSTPANSDSAITLLDNRQIVVFGGRNGVTKYNDVWEYQIRSNLWHRSTAPMNDGVAQYLEGASELSAITKFSYRNTAAGRCDQEGDTFGLPKARPYGDSRSMDWTFLLGGWDNAYQYRGEHIYYKSTDDPRAIVESAVPTKAVTEHLSGITGREWYAGYQDIVTLSGGDAARIARWDASGWSTLGSGLGGEVRAVIVDSSGNLFAGGSFTNAGELGINRIARWNGASWALLGNGLGGVVNTIAVYSNNIYVGGSFTNSGSLSLGFIAQWNGSAWTNLGTGVNGPVHAAVTDKNGHLYVAGDFSQSGSVPANRVARWDGTSWTNLSSGMDATVKTLALSPSGVLYAGGGFTNAGGIAANRFAFWDGSTWNALGIGMDNSVNAILALSSDEVYAGGSFTLAGGGSINRIARWNGSAWISLGSGASGDVNAITSYGRSIYIAGDFTDVGGQQANRIARWNGTNWSRLGSGFDSSVKSLALDRAGVVYAGGGFARAGGGPASPYPSEITVETREPNVTGLNITLYGVVHSNPSNLQIVLVSPLNQSLVLMAGAGGTNSVNGEFIRFSDDALTNLPSAQPIVSGEYKPTSYVDDYNFEGPAPAIPTVSTLNELVGEGESPNGVWRLFVYDQGTPTSGVIDYWRLEFDVDGSSIALTATEIGQSEGGPVLWIGNNSELFSADGGTVNDQTTGYSALNVSDFNLRAECDQVLGASLNLVVNKQPLNVITAQVAAEVSVALNHSNPQYESSSDTLEPSARWSVGTYLRTTNILSFEVFPTSQVVSIDVTELVNEILQSGNWDGTTFGFIFEAVDSLDYATFFRDLSSVTVVYIPSYKIPPEWRYPSSITTAYVTDPLSVRKSHALAYDYRRDRVLLFGGIDGNRVLGDTHEGTLQIGANPNDVSWTEVISVDAPPARYGHAMVYDTKNERFLVFGGFDAQHRPLNDLWQFIPAGVEEDTEADAGEDETDAGDAGQGFWREITEFSSSERPQPRGGAAMIYYGDFDYQRAAEGYCVSGNKQQIVLFGGSDKNTYFNDTWVYNGSRWILVNPVGEQSQGPSPRAYASFVYAQNGGDFPDPSGAGEYRNGADPPCAKPTAFLFGGHVGTLPSGVDTDHDLITDGAEHVLGGPSAGRDPRVNALVEPGHPTETIPFSFNRIGALSGFFPSGSAIANFESLRNRDGAYAFGYGLPFEEYPDAESEGNSVSGSVNSYGVDAQHVSHINLWYHRYPDGDPNDPQDGWELGVPNPLSGNLNSAPPYAYSGRWVYGTRINGNYPDDAKMDLYSPVFSLSLPAADETGSGNANAWFLIFQEWLDLADENDYVQIDVIRPETEADLVTRTSGTNKPPLRVLGPRHVSANTTGTWRRVAVPLDVTAAEDNLFLRFRLTSDSEGTAGGWYIDDVAIAKGGSITGLVTGASGGTNVFLYGINGGPTLYESITSEQGEFSFGLLPVGQYNVAAGGDLTGPIAIGDASTSVHGNPATIDIMDTSSEAVPYPSTLSVSGLSGDILSVKVSLFDITHPDPEKLHVLLKSPDGQTVVLMAGAGGANPIANVSLQFEDTAGSLLPFGSAITGGAYRPTQHATWNFLAPAPEAPYGSALEDVNASRANGDWELYVNDEAGINIGSIALGWELEITMSQWRMDSLPLVQSFKINSIAAGASQITWETAIGRRYQVQYSDDLAADPAVWQDLVAPITATTEQESVTDAGASAHRTYRVLLLTP